MSRSLPTVVVYSSSYVSVVSDADLEPLSDVAKKNGSEVFHFRSVLIRVSPRLGV